MNIPEDTLDGCAPITLITQALSHFNSAVHDYPVVLNIDRACAPAPR